MWVRNSLIGTTTKEGNECKWFLVLTFLINPIFSECYRRINLLHWKRFTLFSKMVANYLDNWGMYGSFFSPLGATSHFLKKKKKTLCMRYLAFCIQLSFHHDSSWKSVLGITLLWWGCSLCLARYSNIWKKQKASWVI